MGVWFWKQNFQNANCLIFLSSGRMCATSTECISFSPVGRPQYLIVRIIFIWSNLYVYLSRHLKSCMESPPSTCLSVSGYCLRHYFCVWWGVWWVCGGSRSTSFTRLHQDAPPTRPLECRVNPFTSPSTALKRVGRGEPTSVSAQQQNRHRCPPFLLLWVSWGWQQILNVILWAFETWQIHCS